MRWCRGDIRRQIEFFDPSVTIAPRALINPPFRGGSCPKSVTHVSLLICHLCPPTIPLQQWQRIGSLSFFNQKPPLFIDVLLPHSVPFSCKGTSTAGNGSEAHCPAFAAGGFLQSSPSSAGGLCVCAPHRGGLESGRKLRRPRTARHPRGSPGSTGNRLPADDIGDHLRKH